MKLSDATKSMKSILVLMLVVLCACGSRKQGVVDNEKIREMNEEMEEPQELQPLEKVVRTDEEWREILEPEVYYIGRQAGTEHAFGANYKHFKKVESEVDGEGAWVCRCCGHKLFKAHTSFDSGSGWPSFYEPYDKNSVIEKVDNSHGWTRVEVLCARCESHLGHVFDGELQFDTPTKRRFCINGGVIEHETEAAE